MSSTTNNNNSEENEVPTSGTEDETSSSSIHESYHINDSDSDEEEDEELDSYEYAQSQDLLEVRAWIIYTHYTWCVTAFAILMFVFHVISIILLYTAAERSDQKSAGP